MSKTLYFYDLETSGLSPKEARVMQFAGQRTGLDLGLLGDPRNSYIRLTQDALPDPGAVLLTGITPQRTIAEGFSEAEFLQDFHDNIVTRDTIFVGYNSVRFDDEFMRYLHYRNFYDPYEWQWKDGRAKWDLLDVVRMTRALRPEGINWPSKGGKSTNRLELLAKENKIQHEDAHDALSDVMALIELAKLVKKQQPKLFDFLLDVMTSKANISKFLDTNKMFVYTSGKYASEFNHTTVVSVVAEHPKRQGVLVFDLRFNPSDYSGLSVEELVALWHPVDREVPRLPVKTLQFNRCPAIAPVSVLNDSSQVNISLTLADINNNYKVLMAEKEDFSKKILLALDVLDKGQEEKYSLQDQSVDSRLYDGFFDDSDRATMGKVRNASPAHLNSHELEFNDKRLTQLLPIYKARNFPGSLTVEEVKLWDEHKKNYLLSGGESSRISKYFMQLEELAKDPKLDKNARFLIEELKLYGESIIPLEDI